MHKIFEISKKVQEAINRKKPIVALESTLISHGLPYPENIKVANESIKAVEDNGAIAATIGIIRGKVKIGLSEEDIQILAKEKKMDDILKTSVACGSYYANGNSLTKKSDYLKVKNLSKKVKIQKV